jgi:endonuclease/exonuclease/phosphatase family metal-dependent hydrolase
MRALLSLAFVALTGCLTIDDDGGVWEPAGSITGPLAPEVGPPPTAVEPPSVLRVVTWNLHYATDIAELAANIRADPTIAAAHVYLFQELEAFPEEPSSRANALAAALGTTWAYAPARLKKDGTHGIAILSRFPLEDVQVRKLPFIDTAYVPRPRNAVAADVLLGDTRVRVVNMHLDVRVAPLDRIRQLRPAVIDQPERSIVGGDFNTNPWAWIENTVPLAGTEAVVGLNQAQIVDDYLNALAYTGAVAPDVATMRLPVVDMRIDNLYVREGAIVASGVEHVEGSDHWPVWFDVVLE